MVGPLSNTWIAAFFIGVQDGETRISKDLKWAVAKAYY